MSAAITPHDAWLYMEFFNRGDIRLIQADDREAKRRTGSATCPWSREAG